MNSTYIIITIVLIIVIAILAAIFVLIILISKYNDKSDVYQKLIPDFHKEHHKHDSIQIYNDNKTIIDYLLDFSSSSKSSTLSLRINDIKLGDDRLQLIDSKLYDTLYCRVSLRNNTMNNLILSEKYKIEKMILFKEVFSFSLNIYQLAYTSIYVELISTMKSSLNELIVGYLDILLPSYASLFPFECYEDMLNDEKDIDVFVEPVGFVCVTLTHITNITIKLDLIATSLIKHYCDNYEDGDFSVKYEIISLNKEGDIIHHSFSLQYLLTNLIGFHESFNLGMSQSSLNMTIEMKLHVVNNADGKVNCIGNCVLDESDDCRRVWRDFMRKVYDYPGISYTRWTPVIKL